MPHVAYELYELHAGQPNTFRVPLTDAADQPIDFGSGDAVPPTLTLYDLAGDEVATDPAQSGYWPLSMDEESDLWLGELTTLVPGVGERLRLVLEFTDPAGNEVRLVYPVIVVPAV